jgi:Ca2+/Na+ antiporter
MKISQRELIFTLVVMSIIFFVINLLQFKKRELIFTLVVVAIIFLVITFLRFKKRENLEITDDNPDWRNLLITTDLTNLKTMETAWTTLKDAAKAAYETLELGRKNEIIGMCDSLLEKWNLYNSNVDLIRGYIADANTYNEKLVTISEDNVDDKKSNVGVHFGFTYGDGSNIV